MSQKHTNRQLVKSLEDISSTVTKLLEQSDESIEEVFNSYIRLKLLSGIPAEQVLEELDEQSAMILSIYNDIKRKVRSTMSFRNISFHSTKSTPFITIPERQALELAK